MRKSLVTLAVLVLASCARPEPTETFSVKACAYRDTGTTRERKERTTCAMRSASKKAGSGTCIMWNHRTVTDHLIAVTCNGEHWQ